MTNNTYNQKITVDELRAFAMQIMLAAGMKPPHAEITAEILVSTDTFGVFTHGTKQLRGLMRNFRDKALDLDAELELVDEGAGWAIIDGHRAIATVSSHLAMNKAIEKARVTGIGYAGVRNSGHFGAAGYYANMAMNSDMIGLAMTNVEPVMAVPGGKEMLMGTNPISYSVPTNNEKPVFMDIATSVVAASKIFAARALGQSIPHGWLVDKEGMSTTDPNHFPEEGAIMPMAAHKGYGIALLIDILTALICGGPFLKKVASWISEKPQPMNQCHAFIAINIGAMIPIDRFKDQMDHLVREIKNSEKAKGVERIYLPGEMEWERREKALKDGMILPDDVVDKLIGAANDYHVNHKNFFKQP